MPKSWLNVKLAVSPQDSEEIERWFFARGAIAVTQETPKDLHVFESQDIEYNDRLLIGVVGLFEDVIDTDLIEADLDALGFESVQLEQIDDENWERAWLDRFKPARFGNRLWVVPTETEFDFSNKDVIRIDPGLAFGTGDHATTRLCLEQLDDISVSGKRVMDYGCGSGVLGIGAAVKGAKEVLCFDIDPRALEAAKKNVELNKVDVLVSLPKSIMGEIDLLFANILAKPIVELKDTLIDALRTDGQLIVSGLLVNQINLVLDAYGPLVNLMSKQELDGWVLLRMEKK
ncbi:MAG: 50S ribosomal protein L11 methyltransferase [Pseudomonadota bacterium]|jgi:ribosomal protein L11 methyltransferase|nr:50S ribosomal protein L11 methyltransferase [Pseudomonadota bacterium]